MEEARAQMRMAAMSRQISRMMRMMIHQPEPFSISIHTNTHIGALANRSEILWRKEEIRGGTPSLFRRKSSSFRLAPASRPSVASTWSDSSFSILCGGRSRFAIHEAEEAQLAHKDRTRQGSEGVENGPILIIHLPPHERSLPVQGRECTGDEGEGLVLVLHQALLATR